MMRQQLCPICQQPVEPSARYPHYVCVACVALAESKDGRPVEAVNAEVWGRVALRLRGSGKPIDGDRLFIKGIECIAREAHFGGVVIQPITSVDPRGSTKALALRRRGRQGP